jgi:hypothetical protein
LQYGKVKDKRVKQSKQKEKEQSIIFETSSKGVEDKKNEAPDTATGSKAKCINPQK